MPIDPRIPMMVQPVEIPNPMNAFLKVEQIRALRDQNALNAMRMQAAEAEAGERNRLRSYMTSADLSKPETRRELLKYGKAGADVGKALSDQEKADVDRQKVEQDVLLDRMKMSRYQLENVTTPDQFIAWHEGNHRDPILGKFFADRGITADQSREKIMQSLQIPGGFESILEQSKVGAEKAIENQRVLRGQDVQMRGQDVTKYGYDLTDARERERMRMQNERDKFARDPDFQQRLAAAKKTGELLASKKTEAITALPTIIEKGERGIRLIDEMVGQSEIKDASGRVVRQATAPHEGFSTYVGAGLPMKYIPGTAASDFSARYDEIMGGAFMEAFTTLKGGGQITEKEGEKAQAAISRMKASQSEKEFITAARELQDIMNKGIQKAYRDASIPMGQPIEESSQLTAPVGGTGLPPGSAIPPPVPSQSAHQGYRTPNGWELMRGAPVGSGDPNSDPLGIR